MRTVRKATGALLGGTTAAVVTVLAGLVGVELAPEVAAALAVILAAVGAWLAPPNETGPA